MASNLWRHSDQREPARSLNALTSYRAEAVNPKAALAPMVAERPSRFWCFIMVFSLNVIGLIR
jgi:hypothetical protein